MKYFAVIGLGRFGSSVARTLAEKGQQVIAIDKNEEFVHDIMDNVTKAVCLDATDEKAVRSIGLQNVDVAICGIGTDMDSSILVTLMLKDLGIPMIVSKADSVAHKKVLEKIGATKVILPEKDTGERLAETLISVTDTVLDHIGLSGNSSIIEVRVPEEFVGKTLRDLDIRSEYGVNVIAIKKNLTTYQGEEEIVEEQVNVTPQADDVIAKGDILIVFGANDMIEELKAKEEFKNKS
ncbi:MAG: TrkA family potassium uptake protein [Candidatus Omnitrophica bacterium]|nr:TrkA family potassium uptake protein [Candidatus Omnitrophota bacterium]MDD5488319.1 TrkA family potassium uptake protein [Candidatus Omnitrophota bacterium]